MLKILNRWLKKLKNKKTELLGIFEKVFSYYIEPKKQEKKLTIRPDLTMKKLNEIVVQARTIIVELYINCENDFQEGLRYF